MSNCEDDNDFLNKAEALIKDWLQEQYFEDIIDDIFYDEPVNEKVFRKVLNKLLSNINEARKTPMEEREYEDYSKVKIFDELIELEHGKIGRESRNKYDENAQMFIISEMLKEARKEANLTQ